MQSRFRLQCVQKKNKCDLSVVDMPSLLSGGAKSSGNPSSGVRANPPPPPPSRGAPPPPPPPPRR